MSDHASPRARSFFWSKLFVGGLVLCTAALTVAGISAHYFDLGADWNATLDMICAGAFAGIAAFALATSQMAAAMAQALRGKPQFQTAFGFACACAVICGLISVGGAHMGALVLGLDWRVVDLGGFLLAFVKPAMSVVIEAAGEAARADADEAKAKAEAEEAARIERLKAMDLESAERRAMIQSGAATQDGPASPPPAAPINLASEREKRAQPPAKPKAKPSGKGAKIAAAVMGSAAALTGAAAAEPAAITRPAQPEPQARTPSFEEMDRAIGELTARGALVSERSLARHIGVRRIDIRRAKIAYGVKTLPPSGSA